MRNNLKNKTSCIVLMAFLCVMLNACSTDVTDTAENADIADVSGEENETAEIESEADTTQSATLSTEHMLQLENAYTAEPGQAYLAVADKNWSVQYWGSTQGDGYMLAYDSGIADITGDGYYVVSVNADTRGFRYAMTGDVDQNYAPEGLGNLAVMISDGELLYPDCVITVERVLVDGEEITLYAKNYTSSNDGLETCANIYTLWHDTPTQDARTEEGVLYDEDGDALDICEDYSAQIISLADFETWTTIEVDFTISGTGKNADTASSDDAEVSEDV